MTKQQGEKLMAAVREFNEEMGRRGRESFDRLCAILEADADAYEAAHPEQQD